MKPQSEERIEIIRKPACKNLVDITMLCIYLSSWDRGSRRYPDHPPKTKAWKGYLSRALKELKEKGLIKCFKTTYQLEITPEGLRAVRDYIEIHFPEWDPFERRS